MDNKDEKQAFEKKEKNRFKLNKQKTAEFFKKNGFYIALFICIAAAGLTAILSLTSTGETPAQTAEATDNKQVENIKDPSLEEEISRLYPSPSATSSPSASPSPTYSPPIQQGTPKPSFYLTAPVKGKIIKPFMMDKLTYNKTLNQWATHNGIDIQAKEGDTVIAALSGTVEAVYTDQIYGGVVILKHDGNKKTVYAGVIADDKIKEGAKVNKNQALGVVKTPYFEAYLGPHLHFELMINNKNEDPTKYFN